MGLPTGGQVVLLPPQTRQLLRDDAIALLLGGFPLSVIDKDVLPAATPVHDVVDGARRIYGLTPFLATPNCAKMAHFRPRNG
jgi:hypothetical protein